MNFKLKNCWSLAEAVAVEYGKLRKSSISFRALSPRQFVEADLNRLAEEGVFPENDFLRVFHEQTEKKILPLFGGNRPAFEQALKSDVRTFAETFEKTCYRHGFNALGIENVNFFVFCFCMVNKGGRGMNPYFMLTASQEHMLNEVLRHMVEDRPVPLMQIAPRNTDEDARDNAFAHLRYRGYVRPDGSLDRNAIKHAMIEFGWLFQSDVHHAISRTIAEFDALSPSKRRLHSKDFVRTADAYLEYYFNLLVMRYMGMSHAFHGWSIEHSYPILEDLCARCENEKKRNRIKMRNEFAATMSALARKLNMPVGEILPHLVLSLAEPKKFRESLQLTSTLQTLYMASLVCEFACEVCPLPEA